MTENIYYLTHNLCFKDNELKIKSNKEDYKIIKNSTWHIYLKDYGWYKINKKWIKRLNKYSQLKDKFSRWGIIDMGGDGDCLFHCIAEAFNSLKYININDKKDNMYTAEIIRNIAAESITDENYNIILDFYKSEYESKEFKGLWNPLKINSINDLKKEIIKMGNNFWGDHIIIQLLELYFKMNIIILNNDNVKIHNTFTNLNINNDIIILYYTTDLHYELVGYYNNKYMQSVFNFSTLPTELLTIYRIDCKE